MTSVTTTELYNHLKTLNKQWFYEKSEVDEGFVAKSSTTGLVKNDGTIDTNTYLTQHQDISGKVDSADLATVATTGSYTDLTNVPETFAPSSHGHSATELTDSSAYSNLGTSANATQHAINTAIDTKIGALLAVELIAVVPSLDTASASTMNKMYLVAESTAETNDAYEIFVTVETEENNTKSYAWEKVDTARIDLSSYALVDHVHGNLTNDGKLGSNADYFVTTTTGGALTSQQKIGNIDTSGAIGSVADKVVVTGTNGVLTASDWHDEVDSILQQLIAYGTPATHLLNPKATIVNYDGSPVNQTYTINLSYDSGQLCEAFQTNSFGEANIRFHDDEDTSYYGSDYYIYVSVTGMNISKIEYMSNNELIRTYTDAFGTDVNNDMKMQVDYDDENGHNLDDASDSIIIYLDNGVGE